MPYIQVDLPLGLSGEQKTALTMEIREKVHAAIGSPREFINVVLREWPEENFRVAGAVPERGSVGVVDG
jgi:4-oxalocrotonate tautomerase family enzyme